MHTGTIFSQCCETKCVFMDSCLAGLHLNIKHGEQNSTYDDLVLAADLKETVLRNLLVEEVLGNF